MRDGPADEAEVDVTRRLEADRLERARDEATGVREVLREHHVFTALEDAKLLRECARRPTEVRRRDHLEHDLARSLDAHRQRAERPQRPADAEIEGERATSEEPVGSRTESGDHTGGNRDESGGRRVHQTKCMTRVLAGAVLLLAVAGCGGADGGELSDAERERVRSVERELATEPDVGPGLGEASPPAAITAGWKTDFGRRAVPLSEFQSGGPGKDGIPAIDRPMFIAVDEVDFLEPQEPVIALEVKGEVRAYPIQILIWHEIVNDVVGGTSVAVTFCPLCNTAIVFDRRVDGKALTFGTTGNLRNADLVMYDLQTESWWQQFGGRALVGELTGAELDQLPAKVVAWREFEREEPDGKVLSRETGHERDYGKNPYTGYDDIDSPPFVATNNSDDKRLAPKERVVFIERAGDAVVIPFSVLSRRKELCVDVGGQRLVVRWRPGVASSLDTGSVAAGRDVGTAEVRKGRTLVAFDEPFWFAVAAFRPGVRIVR